MSSYLLYPCHKKRELNACIKSKIDKINYKILTILISTYTLIFAIFLFVDTLGAIKVIVMLVCITYYKYPVWMFELSFDTFIEGS